MSSQYRLVREDVIDLFIESIYPTKEKMVPYYFSPALILIVEDT